MQIAQILFLKASVVIQKSARLEEASLKAKYVLSAMAYDEILRL